jgi:hypothetical protein
VRRPLATGREHRPTQDAQGPRAARICRAHGADHPKAAVFVRPGSPPARGGIECGSQADQAQKNQRAFALESPMCIERGSTFRSTQQQHHWLIAKLRQMPYRADIEFLKDLAFPS